MVRLEFGSNWFFLSNRSCKVHHIASNRIPTMDAPPCLKHTTPRAAVAREYPLPSVEYGILYTPIFLCDDPCLQPHAYRVELDTNSHWAWLTQIVKTPGNLPGLFSEVHECHCHKNRHHQECPLHYKNYHIKKHEFQPVPVYRQGHFDM